MTIEEKRRRNHIAAAKVRVRYRAAGKCWCGRDLAANKQRCRECIAHTVKYAYGMRSADFDALLISQAGRCAICRHPFGITRKDGPCVDHCHRTGRVRGLLCHGCNVLCGTLEMDRGDGVIERAILYLGAV